MNKYKALKWVSFLILACIFFMSNINVNNTKYFSSIKIEKDSIVWDTCVICNERFINQIPLLQIDTIKTDTFKVKKLPKHVLNFIETHFDRAVKIQKNNGVPIIISLGIGGLESGWGTSYAALTRFNFHGLYGGYRTFESIDAGWAEFGIFLTKYDRYKPLIGVTNYKKYAWLLHKCGYNPFPHYPPNVIKIIEYAQLEYHIKRLLKERKVNLEL